MTILKQLWTKEVEECEVKNSYQYVFELQEKLEDTLKLAHSELEKAQQKGKHYYDRRSKVRKFPRPPPAQINQHMPELSHSQHGC